MNSDSQQHGSQPFVFGATGNEYFHPAAGSPLQYGDFPFPLAQPETNLHPAPAPGFQDNVNIHEIQQYLSSPHEQPRGFLNVPHGTYFEPHGSINSSGGAHTIGEVVRPGNRRIPRAQQQNLRFAINDSSLFPIQEEADGSSGRSPSSTERSSKRQKQNPPGPSSVRSAPAGRTLYPSECPVPKCKKELKNPSDAAKHHNQHTKPFRCDQEGCSKSQIGFGTENDLERHRKSVHTVIPGKGCTDIWICQGCRDSNAAAKNKIWPRLDNFKAHMRRKHKEWNEEELVERSRKPPIPSDSGYVSQRMPNGYGQQGHMSQLGSPAINMSRGPSNEGDDASGGFDSSPMNPLAGIGYGAGSNTAFSFEPASTQVPGTGLYQGDQDPFTAQHFPGPHSTCDFDVPSNAATLGSGLRQHYHQQPPMPVVGEPRRGAPISSNKAGEFPCPEPGCAKTKKRECDLRKHMKRHTRPYGCTFEGCEKKLGSRNDWKRHECSQHHITEMWYCGECKLGIDSQDTFAKHLIQRHHYLRDSNQLRVTMGSSHLGRDAHYRYWCGFCNRLIPQETPSLQQGQPPGVNALEIRLHHIGEHYDKDKLEPDRWQHMGTFKMQNAGPERASRSDRTLRPRRTEVQDDSSDLGESGIPDWDQQSFGPQPGLSGSNDQGYWVNDQMVHHQGMMINPMITNVTSYYDDALDAPGEDDESYQGL